MSDEKSLPKFEPGQVWCYETRANEPQSRILIGRLEELETLGTVAHVLIDNVEIAPLSPGELAIHQISHVPIALAALKASVTELESAGCDAAAIEDGYRAWREAYDSGTGGIFTISAAEIVEAMAQVIGNPNSV